MTCFLISVTLKRKIMKRYERLCINEIIGKKELSSNGTIL